MKRLLKYFMLSVTIMTLLSSMAFADGWTPYTAEKFGFSMLVPKGAEITFQEESGNWGGINILYQDAMMIGLAKLGKPAKAKGIQEFLVKLTGTPQEMWSMDESGSGNGWTWYQMVSANNDGVVLYGGYGVGDKGSYLLMLFTNEEDFNTHHDDYVKWFQSMKLN